MSSNMTLTLDINDSYTVRTIDITALLNRLESPLENDAKELHESLKLSRAAVGMLLSLFNETRNPEHLTLSIEILNKVLQCHGASIDNAQRATVLSKLGEALYKRHILLKRTEDIDCSIGAYREAIRLSSGSSDLEYEDIPSILYGLGDKLLVRFRISGDINDISEAIDALQQAVDLIPENNQLTLPKCLYSLGSFLSKRFKVMKNPDDALRAVQAQRKALHLLSPDSSFISLVLAHLATSLETEFTITNDIKTLDEAISVGRDAISLVSPHHPDLSASISFHLACSLSNRFKVTKDIHDINEAIEFQRRVISLVTGTTVMYKLNHMLSFLGLLLYDRIEMLQKANDINESIYLYIRAVGITPTSDPLHASMLDRLVDCHSIRFKDTEQAIDLKWSIIFSRRVLSITPSNHPTFPYRLSQLALCMEKQYNISNELSDLDEAIELYRQAVNLTKPNHKYHPRYLRNLGYALALRFKRSLDVNDINESIAVIQEAARHFSANGSELADLFTKLGNAFFSRYSITNERGNLEEGISLLNQAVEMTPPTDAQYLYRMPVLGMMLFARFQALPDIGYIDSAIKVFRQSLAANKSDNIPYRLMLTYLGRSYLKRYKMSSKINDVHSAVSMWYRASGATRERKEASNDDVLASSYYKIHLQVLISRGETLLQRHGIHDDIRDISEAISAFENAVSIASLRGEVEALSISLRHLGTAFHRRYNLTLDPTDIDRSLEFHRKVLHNYRAASLRDFSSFGSVLTDAYQVNRDVDVLNKAIRIQSQAIEIALQFDSKRQMPTEWYNIGVSFMRRYNALKNSQDLEESINAMQKALDLTSLNDTKYPERLAYIAKSLMCKYDTTREEIVLRQAYALMKRVALFPGGSPSKKIEAALHWATISENDIFNRGEKLHALRAYDCIFELLPLMVWVGQTVSQRHIILEKISKIVTDSARNAASLGRLDKALEWLEQGRSVVWNQIGALRSPIEHLFSVDKNLAEDFLYVSRKLEEAGVAMLKNDLETSLTAPFEIELSEYDITGQHHFLAQRWNELVLAIRSLPDFENFMRPSSSDEIMRNVPRNGIVVILNVHNDGCDAFLLRNDTGVSSGNPEIQHIVLPVLSYKRAEELKFKLEVWRSKNGRGKYRCAEGERAGKLADAISASSSSMTFLLRELWDAVVEPVIVALQLKPNENSTKRLWWCTTGPLTFLPIHAAGIYRPNPKLGSHLSDYVVSSYIPTLGALGQTQKRSTTTKFNGLVAVSQSMAPGMPAIPSTEKEIKNIQQILKSSDLEVQRFEGEDATIATISEAMQSKNWIHLACHGTQHPSDPLKSAFHFHDGPLTLSEIMQLDIPDADFAFLSACQTSTGHEKLPDEAVHLAAGMLTAGYKSIIATMWSISDMFAPDIAYQFYKDMLNTRNANGELDSSNAALALHNCTRMIVAQRHMCDGGEFSWDWIPFVHIGL